MITFDEIQEIRRNKYHLQQLKEISNIVPFVGAGISSCCYPMWKEFLEGFDLKDDERDKLNIYLQNGEFEDAASYVQTCTGEEIFIDTVKDTFNVSHMDMEKFYSYIRLIPYLASNLCITTNLDMILEKAYELCEKEVITITPDMQDLINESIGAKHNYLIKLHGSYEESSKYVLTKEQYDTSYGIDSMNKVDFQNPFVNALSRIMLSRSFIFLGCSLQNDRTLHVLKQIMEKYNNHIQHYALMELLDTNDEIIEQERRLSEHGIKIIWYPKGQYESIGIIIQNLLQNIKKDDKTYSTLPKNTSVILGRDNEINEIKKK